MSLIILYIMNILILEANPWDLDRKTKDFLNSHIDLTYQKNVDESLERGEQYYITDFEHKILNSYPKTCSYCQDRQKPSQFNFEEKLAQFNFEKKRPAQLNAHCWGSTLFFVQYLLSHPEIITHSCADILSKISNASDFEEKSHFFSLNQHPFYLFHGLESPIELNPEVMKKYFQILLEKTPSDYHFLPLSVNKATFDKTSIYVTLQDLPNKLIIVGYTKESAEESYNHCIAVSTHPEKLFVFDSNLGMYHFPDLETLSWVSEKALKDCRFRWLLAFPLDQNK